MHFGSYIHDIRKIGVSLVGANEAYPTTFHLHLTKFVIIPTRIWWSTVYMKINLQSFEVYLDPLSVLLTATSRWRQDDITMTRELFISFFFSFCFVYLDSNGDHGDGQDEVAQNGPGCRIQRVQTRRNLTAEWNIEYSRSFDWVLVPGRSSVHYLSILCADTFVLFMFRRD